MIRAEFKNGTRVEYPEANDTVDNGQVVLVVRRSPEAAPGLMEVIAALALEDVNFFSKQQEEPPCEEK